MFTTFLGGLGSKLAERWLIAMMTPAFGFWGGGLGAWVWRFGWTPLEGWFTRQSEPLQVSLLIGVLLGVVVSGFLAQRLEVSVLRLLEGYWPRWAGPIRRLPLRWQAHRVDRAERRWQELAGKRDLASQGRPPLTPAEIDEFVSLEWRLKHAPAAKDRLMPTNLGNILRAAELSPRDKYGLDALICWPRLWLILPEEVKKELTEARSSLDTTARIWLWSALFLVWAFWAWWAVPVGLLTAFFAYHRMLSAAAIYGDLLEATFDLHRAGLYTALRWPLPANPAEERESGIRLTAYLWRGSDQSTPVFTLPRNK